MQINIEEKKSLAEFTSWLVGGEAEFYCAPKNVAELKLAMLHAGQKNLPITLLGRGSNTLISDKGVSGLLIHMINLNEVKVIATDPKVVIESQAGAQKSEVLKHFMKFRLAPAIFLAGLPGDMAGGVVMNAGVGHKVSPKEFCEIIESFDVLFLNKAGEIESKTFKQEEINWSYRKSCNWQPGVIVNVRVSWPNKPNEDVLQFVREGNKRRKETQPLSQPSCGSVFKNPEGDHAGRLIEDAGLKGFSIGGAQVSEKHANFIVNTGLATAQDIQQVIDHVQMTVKKKHNVELSNEVIYLGTW